MAQAGLHVAENDLSSFSRPLQSAGVTGMHHETEATQV